MKMQQMMLRVGDRERSIGFYVLDRKGARHQPSPVEGIVIDLSR